MEQVEILLRLKRLYQERACGISFCEPFTSVRSDRCVSLPNELDSLKNMVDSCVLCELSKGGNSPTFGLYSRNPRVVFISLAPLVDAKYPSVFIGRSGEMLQRIVREVLEVKESEISLLSLVKCQPTPSTKVNPLSLSACRPYFLKQIELLPIGTVLITLGEEVYRYLSEEKGDFMLHRGIRVNFLGRNLIPTFSLSHLLRNPSAKKDAYKDFLLAKSYL